VPEGVTGVDPAFIEGSTGVEVETERKDDRFPPSAAAAAPTPVSDSGDVGRLLLLLILFSIDWESCCAIPCCIKASGDALLRRRSDLGGLAGDAPLPIDEPFEGTPAERDGQ
jgi:hypothetical protein